MIGEQVSLPIINGYVAVPDIAQNKRLTIAEALVAVPSATFTKRLGRLFFVFPQFDEFVGYPIDWFAQLRAASHI